MAAPPKILILEDDDTFRGLLSKALEDRGYDVRAVGRGIEAVKLAAETAFDLIVTDIRMEGMDGLEALAQVKQSQPEVKSLVVTGYSNEDDSIRAIRLGVSDYLKKPFRLNTFVEAVRNALGKSLPPRSEGIPEQLPAVEWGARWWTTHLAQNQPKAQTALAKLDDLLEQLSTPLAWSAGRRLVCSTALRLYFGERLSGESVPATVEQSLGDECREALAGLRGQERKSACYEILLALGEPEQELEELVGQVLAGMDWAPNDGSEEEQSAEQQDAASRQRGLLSLAKALSGRGEPEAARQALAEASALGPSAEMGQALLELARLESAEGVRAEKVREAVSLADKLGPAERCRLLLEAGVLARSEELLDQASDLLQSVQLPGLQGLARLALHLRTGRPQPLEAAVETLTQPQFYPELSEAAPWLLEECLNREGSAEIGRLRQRLILEFPHLLYGIIASGRLDAEARRRVIGELSTDEAWRRATAQLLAKDPDPEVSRSAQKLLGQAEAEVESKAGKIKVISFGTFRAAVGGNEIQRWRTKKTRWMMACLASRPGASFNLEQLMEKFWPGDERLGRQSVFSAISHLRGALKKAGGGSKADYVIKDAGGFRLNPEQIAYNDVAEFQAILKSNPDDLAALRRLSALLKGPYLDTCYMDWALTERARLERESLEALLKLAKLCQESELFEESLEHLEKALKIDPYCEPAVERTLLGYRELGRPTQAIRFFEGYQKRLSRDLDLEPPLELVKLYHEIRLLL